MIDPVWGGAVGALGGTALSGGFAAWTTKASGNREDQRTFAGDRKQSYIAFMSEWRRRRDILWDPNEERSIREPPPDDWWQPIYDQVHEIRLFGNDEVADSAERAIRALDNWAGASDSVEAERARETNRAYEDFLAKARQTLGGV